VGWVLAKGRMGFGYEDESGGANSSFHDNWKCSSTTTAAVFALNTCT